MHQKLHHISLRNHYQFITFRTHASIDAYVRKLQEMDMTTKLRQYRIDDYLDRCENGAWFFGEHIGTMKEIVLEKNGVLYEVETFCVMPNHLHLLIRQDADLAKIIKFIKGKSAIVFNKRLGLSGRFWAEGYFDKVIRDDAHFEKVYAYVVNNPLKAGLEDAKERVYRRE